MIQHSASEHSYYAFKKQKYLNCLVDSTLGLEWTACWLKIKRFRSILNEASLSFLPHQIQNMTHQGEANSAMNIPWVILE